MKDGKVIHLVDFIEKKQIIDPSNQVEIKEINHFTGSINLSLEDIFALVQHGCCIDGIPPGAGQ